MSRRLIIRDKAKTDLADAVSWYHSRQNELGEELLAAVNARLIDVANRPQTFAIVEKNDIRRALVKRFPYAIYFVERPDFISVLAIFHTRQDARRRLRGRR